MKNTQIYGILPSFRLKLCTLFNGIRNFQIMLCSKLISWIFFKEKLRLYLYCLNVFFRKEPLSKFCITLACTIIFLCTLMLLRSKAFIEMIESIPMIRLLFVGMSCEMIEIIPMIWLFSVGMSREMIESIPMIQLLSVGMSRLTLWLRRHHCWSRTTGGRVTTGPRTCVADVAKRCSLQRRSWEEVVWVFFWNSSVCVIKFSVCVHF